MTVKKVRLGKADLPSKSTTGPTMLDPGPYTNGEWAKIKEITERITSVSFQDDEVLRASYLAELVEVIDELLVKYGPDPVLYETKADYILDDNQEQIRLYEQAVRLALELDRPTFSIRISVAEVYLDDPGYENLIDPQQTLYHLEQCEEEIKIVNDEDYLKQWKKLKEKATVLLTDQNESSNETF